MSCYDNLLPFSDEELALINSEDAYALGAHMHFFTDTHFPSLDTVKLAIVGVSTHPQLFTSVRSALYRLADIGHHGEIADLGNLNMEDATEEVLRHRLAQTLGYLREHEILPILLVADVQLQAEILRICEAWGWNSPAFIHPRADVAVAREWKNASLIGFQQCLVPLSHKQKKIHWVSLGQLRHDFSQSELYVRQSDSIFVDLAVARRADAQGYIGSYPGGFYTEELCKLAQYAGLSEQVKLCALFMQTSEPNELVAQLIWYFIEGFVRRTPDHPLHTGGRHTYIQYNVPIIQEQQHVSEIVFFRNMQTQRWWMKLPVSLAQGRVVPCMEKDYEQALNGQMPDHLLYWQHYLQK